MKPHSARQVNLQIDALQRLARTINVTKSDLDTAHRVWRKLPDRDTFINRENARFNQFINR